MLCLDIELSVMILKNIYGIKLPYNIISIIVHIVTWCYMIWYDRILHDYIILYYSKTIYIKFMIWHDIIRISVICQFVRKLHDIILYDKILYDMIIVHIKEHLIYDRI